MPTMREVADMAGVAPSTVSRVLNGSDTVSPALRQRVLEAVAATNYRPNLLGRTLRTSRTNTLAFILPGLDAAPNIEAIYQAELNTQRAGYGMLIADTRGARDVELDVIRNLTARRVDGVLCTPVNEPAEIGAIFAEADVPVVFLFSHPITAPGRCATAVLDQRAGIMECAKDLAENGHDRIAILRRPHPFAQSVNYRARFVEGLEEAGVQEADVREVVIPIEAGGREVIEQTIAGPQAPTTLVADLGSLPWLLVGLRELGLKPGRDISVVTLGHSTWLDALDPGINAIAVDVPAYIAKASAALLALIRGEEPGSLVSEPSKYHRRGSVIPVRNER